MRVLMTVFLFFLWCHPVAAVDLRIVPGARGAGIALGGTLESVQAVLGPPQSTRAEGGGQEIARSVWQTGTGNFVFVYSRQGRVVQVGFASAAGATAEGLAPGKQLADVRKIYGKLEKVTLISDEGGQPYFWYDAVAEGIAFCVTPFEGRGEEEISAIAVHEPGQLVLTY